MFIKRTGQGKGSLIAAPGFPWSTVEFVCGFANNPP